MNEKIRWYVTICSAIQASSVLSKLDNHGVIPSNIKLDIASANTVAIYYYHTKEIMF